MNEEKLNISIRKFLKMAGVSTQREIEYAVTRAVQEGVISGTETFPARLTLEIAGLRLKAEFDGEIRLEARRAAPRSPQRCTSTPSTTAPFSRIQPMQAT